MTYTPLNAKYAKCKKPKLIWDRYQDRNGEPGNVCLSVGHVRASVFVTELPDSEIAIKDYSENEGVLAWLIENKIVSQPVRYVPSGYVTIPICKILVHFPGEKIEITNNACNTPVHACWATVTEVDGRFVHVINEHKNIDKYHLDGRPVGGGHYHMRKMP